MTAILLNLTQYFAQHIFPSCISLSFLFRDSTVFRETQGNAAEAYRNMRLPSGGDSIDERSGGFKNSGVEMRIFWAEIHVEQR